MKFKILYILVALLVLNACASNDVAPIQAIQAIQNTGNGTLVIKPIEFSKDAYIRKPIQDECNLPGKLTQYIAENAANQYAQIITGSGSIPADAHILKIEIEQVDGLAGGAWTGSKRVLIKGTLTKNGKVLGDFKARRYSGGGMFAVFKGTCVILGRCVRTLGSDVARWLTRPISNALLGNM